MIILKILFGSFLFFAILSVLSIFMGVAALKRKFGPQQRTSKVNDNNTNEVEPKVFAKDEGEYVSYEDLE